MDQLINYFFESLLPAIPLELLACFYLMFAIIILKALVDIFLLFVRWVLHVR